MSFNKGKPILTELPYLPPVSWFRSWKHEPVIFLDKHEHYVKASYRNRCHILGPNGLLRMSVPLIHGKDQRNSSGEVRISYEQPWQKIHWMTLCSCYRRSPYFEYFEDVIQPFYHTQYTFLFEFNYALLQMVSAILSINTEFQFTERYIPATDENYTDQRSLIMPSRDSQFTNKDQPYTQVFSDRFEFMPDLSIIDFIFNNGTKFPL